MNPIDPFEQHLAGAGVPPQILFAGRMAVTFWVVVMLCFIVTRLVLAGTLAFAAYKERRIAILWGLLALFGGTFAAAVFIASKETRLCAHEQDPERATGPARAIARRVL